MASEAYITKQFFSEKNNAGEALCLSLFLSPDTFAYAISQNNFNSVTELCEVQLNGIHLPSFDYADGISFLIHNHQLHQKKFAKINITVLNRDFTLVPKAYATAGDIKNLLQFSTGNDSVKKALQHQVANTSVCYNLQADLLALLEKTFPNASIRHSAAVNLSLLFSQHSVKNADVLLLIGNTNMELLARRGGDLLFYNVFSFESNEDVLYYLLFMMEQFQLNPLLVKLSIAAERAVDDELLKNIKKYIRFVSYCVNDANIQLPGQLLSLPSHYYFSLLNQHLCEL